MPETYNSFENHDKFPSNEVLIQLIHLLLKKDIDLSLGDINQILAQYPVLHAENDNINALTLRLLEEGWTPETDDRKPYIELVTAIDETQGDFILQVFNEVALLRLSIPMSADYTNEESMYFFYCMAAGPQSQNLEHFLENLTAILSRSDNLNHITLNDIYFELSRHGALFFDRGDGNIVTYGDNSSEQNTPDIYAGVVLQEELSELAPLPHLDGSTVIDYKEPGAHSYDHVKPNDLHENLRSLRGSLLEQHEGQRFYPQMDIPVVVDNDTGEVFQLTLDKELENKLKQFYYAFYLYDPAILMNQIHMFPKGREEMDIQYSFPTKESDQNAVEIDAGELVDSYQVVCYIPEGLYFEPSILSKMVDMLHPCNVHLSHITEGLLTFSFECKIDKEKVTNPYEIYHVEVDRFAPPNGEYVEKYQEHAKGILDLYLQALNNQMSFYVDFSNISSLQEQYEMEGELTPYRDFFKECHKYLGKQMHIEEYDNSDESFLIQEISLAFDPITIFEEDFDSGLLLLCISVMMDDKVSPDRRLEELQNRVGAMVNEVCQDLGVMEPTTYYELEDPSLQAFLKNARNPSD